MINDSTARSSRRQFIAAGGLSIAGAWLNAGSAFAQEDVLVETAFKIAARTKLTVQTLRRNISVLLGLAEISQCLADRMANCWWTRKS